MNRIGIAGVGHLGRHHLRLLQDVPDLEVAGCYDTDPGVQDQLREQGLPVYETFGDLLSDADAVDIVVPTRAHYELATEALSRGKHVFLEKPIAETLEQARDLVQLAGDQDVILQVGHIERFNPAILALKDFPLNPRFIESHRLAQFQQRGTDVAVVLDLMIHDIDIILSLVRSPVENVEAAGVSVITNSIDIANARLSFENGCVANITASRISQKAMRKLRIFQPQAYVSVDFQSGNAEIYRLKDAVGQDESIPVVLGEMTYQEVKKYIVYEQPHANDVNALKEELVAFGRAITNHQRPVVSGEDGLHALEVAQLIQQKIQEVSSQWQ